MNGTVAAGALLELVLVLALLWRRRELSKAIRSPAPVPAGPLSHVRLIPVGEE